MRRLLVTLSMIGLLLSGQAALADKRVAFVVGNGAYAKARVLPNPPIDARAMARALRNVGFEVVEGIDLTHEEMDRRLYEFGRKANGADIAVFFYAGYGIAVGGTNYLLPVDADIKSEADIKSGGPLNVDRALDQTMSDAKVKLVFLDACRENPFAARIRAANPIKVRSAAEESGLAPMKSGEGTLIAFATGPGQTALDGEQNTNSPFTRALIDHITKPGVEIQQAMTEVRAQVNQETNKGQLPWGHTNLLDTIYLNPVEKAPGASAKPPAPPDSPAVSTAPDSPSRPELPEFPWPPPSPSTYYVLPDKLLKDRKTLGEATDAIIAALERTGYVERTFYRTTPGGVALVTRLERIESDGTPVEPERWSISEKGYQSAADFAKFLRGLFFVEEGHYRLIVFILQKESFVPAAKEMAEPEARDLIKRGANILPPEAGNQSYDGNHCTVMIYEFTSDGTAVQFVKQSSLTAKQHLDKAGVLSLLDKAN
jgi:hypothetical protein